MRNTNRYLQTVCLLLMFCFVSPALSAQDITVSGSVKSASGESLIGARIGIEGSSDGTLADINGEFTLRVAPQGSLVVSYFGYVTRVVPVNGRSVIDVVLDADSQIVEEVVVIGYGTQRREAVTGSVASVRGDVMREVPGGNISQSLQGRIAGVQMTQSSSKPGSNMEIRIRGARSLTASNDPLVVLDGIPFAGSLSDVDPNSVKGIDILKDASATAIYGSRGANGVILITTKTGQRGAETTAKVSYSGYYGVKNAVKFPMMDGDQFYALKQYIALTTPPDVSMPYSGLGGDEKAGVDTDWQDLLYRQGFVTSHDIGVAGGSGTSSYSLGAGYYKDQAVIPGQNFQRFSLRANIDMEAGKYFRFGLMSNSNYNYNQGQQFGPGQVLSHSPLVDPFNEDGTLKRSFSMIADSAVPITRDFIEENKDKWRNDTRTMGTFNTIYAEVKVPWVEGLKYRANLGLNYTQTHNGTFRGIGVGQANAEEPSTAAIDNRNTINWTIENLLTYDRTFNDKHNVNVTALYSAEQTTYNRSNMSGRNFLNDRFMYWNIGRAEGTEAQEFHDRVAVNADNQDYWQRAMLSYMGRIMYSYDNKYMISAAVRSDASSVLAPGHQWHTYPAVSAGWNIANEQFMQSVRWVNSLKLRVGFGQTSNQAINPYQTLGLLGTALYNFGNENVTGFRLTTLPNSELGWEFSSTWNFGVDFSLFDNRLTGTIEYYTQKTKNVLQNVNLPTTSGVGSYTANIGKTQNKGIELTLNGVIIDNMNGWTWEAGINLYANRNKLVELASKAPRNEGNSWFVGYPINSVFDYEYERLWQEEDMRLVADPITGEMKPYLSYFDPNAGPGTIKVKYTGGYHEGTDIPDRIVGQGSYPADHPTKPNEAYDDRQIMSLEADFMGGFNTRVAWKDLDLSIVGSFQSGGMLISTLYQGNGYLNNLWGRRGQVDVDYWRPDNTGARFPGPWSKGRGDSPKYMNSAGYFDGSYMKISVITLGYSLPKKWMDKAGIGNVRIYATVQNPFVFFSDYHKLSGLDPEPNTNYADGGSIASPGAQALRRFLVVGYNTPNTRNYLFGANITF